MSLRAFFLLNFNSTSLSSNANFDDGKPNSLPQRQDKIMFFFELGNVVICSLPYKKKCYLLYFLVLESICCVPFHENCCTHTHTKGFSIQQTSPQDRLLYSNSSYVWDVPRGSSAQHMPSHHSPQPVEWCAVCVYSI